MMNRISYMLYSVGKLAELTNTAIKKELLKGYFRNMKYHPHISKEVFIHNDYYIDLKKEKPLILDFGSKLGITYDYYKTLYPKANIICYDCDYEASLRLMKRFPRANVNIKFLESFNYKTFRRIDLIKMDIEGSEIEILQDFIKQKAFNKVENWIIEFHYPINKFLQFEELFNYYDVIIKRGGIDTYSHQGYLIYMRKK